MKLGKRQKSFTLAEVLITLGIIGVVASMTIPTLMNNYLKNQTVTRLQKAYTTISQAIKLSEIDNGQAGTWNYGASNGDDALTWFNTYLAPYMKYTNITKYWNSIVVDFLDGTSIQFGKGSYMDVYIYLYGYGKSKTIGKDVFVYDIIPNEPNKPFQPQTTAADWALYGQRTFWTTSSNACTPSGTKGLCAGLIMYDSWQIKSDYPYFN